MSNVRYQPLGPLLAGEGSRAFLGLEINGLGARPVVLVWVPEEISDNADTLAKLRQETAMAAKLDHPHVIRVHGLADLDGGLARVVEFVNGESLRRILDACKRLPAAMAVRIVADAAQGVHYAQQMGAQDGSVLIHGELRPETLLVSFEGVCKVTGYGAVLTAPKELGGQRIPGRRLHAAPEQVVGGRKAMNPQTDVYLLGVILYECLTGAVPFSDQKEVDRAILNRPLPVPSPDVMPVSIFQVIKQAMSKKASERYPTSLAFREALERAAGQIASREELAAYLVKLFPEDHPARAARRLEIEAGMAEVERTSAAPPVTAATAAPSPARPRVSLQLAIALGAATLLGILGYLFLPPTSQRSDAPPLVTGGTRPATDNGGAVVSTESLGKQVPAAKQTAVDRLDAAVTAGSPAAAIDNSAPDASVVSASAADSVGQDASVALAATQDSNAAASDAGVAPLMSFVDIAVEPAVDVSLNGRPLGKSPVQLSLPVGKHTVQLNDPERLIHVSRTFTVGPKSKTSVRLALRTGFVKVTAPQGAQISIDDKTMGTAPIEEFSLFEGRHRILVIHQSAKWQQAFSVKPDEHLTFTVESTPPK